MWGLALKERFTWVFLQAEVGPVASIEGAAATMCTVGYVIAVWEAVKQLWKDHETEIKRRCAPPLEVREVSAL